jgi:methylenetetrahydrofolate dehydrogenase (NADP+)/methenyltetrahydrofolate cyclohydrolase
MAAKLIKGAEVAAEIREELKKEVEELKTKHKLTPGLVTILVGEDPGSVSYVTAKQKTAHELGFHSVQDNQNPDISEEALLALIDKYNKAPEIHGILVQLPLPKHIDSNKVLYGINPDKDVDAFHPVNVGRILIGNYAFLPCTPAGCQELIVRGYGDPKGKEVVVVGRSNIVGKPMVAIMIQKRAGANATVTCVHTGTPKEKMIEHCKRADILIVAAGVPKYVQADWVKPGACVIDVGVNRIGKSEKTGKAILAGDVDFETVK